MSGHVFQRNGKWGFVLEAARDPGTGKRRQVKRSGFRTKKEANEAYAHMRASLSGGSPLLTAARQMTVAELVNEWHQAASPSLRASTVVGYKNVITNWIVPHFGAVKIRDVTPDQLEDLYATLSREGGKNGRPLSPRSVRYAHSVLHLAFDRAVRRGYLPSNPAATKIAKPRQARRQPTIWTVEDAKVFLETVKDDRLFALWKLMLATGVRRGEALGLRWQDLDEDSGTNQVVQTVVVVGGKIKLSEPKTEASRRTLYTGPQLLEALRAHRERQDHERKEAVGAWQASGLIFTNTLGGPIDPNNLYDMFHDATERAGLPKIRLHDLRHTVATLALRENINPKLVQELLGHSSIQITLETYSHALQGMHREASLQIENVLK